MKKKAEDKKVRYGKNDFVYHLLLLMWSKTKTETYLDIGCGTGSVTDQVSKKFDVSETYGVDMLTEERFKDYRED